MRQYIVDTQGMALPASNDATTDSIDNVNEAPSIEPLQPRAFQFEMLEESLRRNIIVAMDTGAGKTLVAILRMRAELEKAAPEKVSEHGYCIAEQNNQLVWFLAPNVALADQQAKVIAAHIPSVQTRLLLGADGVDHWSEQWIWNEVLNGVEIVISTHQYEILLDALIHGFVQMARLSLLVFDEAHHCMANHPASRILRDFYHPQLAVNRAGAPAILGLTASPIVNGKAGQLE
ncbi:MAG: hypothetical protein L6R40_005129 [Gallowayella cf. fulva]|nr:MAG: hypothetical protein L6R40_005129 [Xanthomendoza cf. fulva]